MDYDPLLCDGPAVRAERTPRNPGVLRESLKNSPNRSDVGIRRRLPYRNRREWRHANVFATEAVKGILLFNRGSIGLKIAEGGGARTHRSQRSNRTVSPMQNHTNCFDWIGFVHYNPFTCSCPNVPHPAARQHRMQLCLPPSIALAPVVSPLPS